MRPFYANVKIAFSLITTAVFKFKLKSNQTLVVELIRNEFVNELYGKQS